MSKNRDRKEKEYLQQVLIIFQNKKKRMQDRIFLDIDLYNNNFFFDAEHVADTISMTEGQRQ